MGNVTIGGNAISLTGLAVHPTTRILYGVTGGSSPNNPNSLVTINKATGAATLIGALGRTLADVTFRSDGTLYGMGGRDQDLYTVEPTTGATTLVGSPVVVGNVGQGLSFLPLTASGLLYASTHGVNGEPYTRSTPRTGRSSAR